MSVTNLAKYGTTERPDWAKHQDRKDAAAQRRYVAQRNAEARKRDRDALPMVRFDAAELASLTKAARAGLGNPGGLWSILVVQVVQKNGTPCLHLRPERAAEFARWMRQPGVDAFGPILARMEEIAGRAAPTGSAIKMDASTHKAILATLDAAGDEIGDAAIAAQFLRAARFDRSLIYVYVTEAQAARLSDVLVAVGADRLLISQLNRIAGRVA